MLGIHNDVKNMTVHGIVSDNGIATLCKKKSPQFFFRFNSVSHCIFNVFDCNKSNGAPAGQFSFQNIVSKLFCPFSVGGKVQSVLVCGIFAAK